MGQNIDATGGTNATSYGSEGGGVRGRYACAGLGANGVVVLRYPR